MLQVRPLLKLVYVLPRALVDIVPVMLVIFKPVYVDRAQEERRQAQEARVQESDHARQREGPGTSDGSTENSRKPPRI